MGKNKTVILVVTHKPDKVYKDDIYTPIQVGKSISKYDLGFIGDNTGDNISEKNPMYCELTAQYWAWKNLDCEYIGLCHYRRYFETLYTSEKLDKLLKKYDAILPEPIYHGIRGGSLLNKLKEELTLEDMAIFFMVIKKLYPQYEGSVISYFNNNMDIPYNMFICKKNIFDDFCEWQFSILFECEKLMKLSQYTRLRRIFGYLGECLLPVYMLHNKFKIKHDLVVSFIGVKGKKHFTKSKYLYSIFNREKPSSLEKMISDPAVYTGLKNDGIEL